MIRSIALAGVAFASIHVLPERVDKPIVCDAVLKTSNGSVPDSLDVRVVQADGKNDPVICGDFNSNKIWDKWDRWWNHSDVINELSELGIESLYHTFYSQEQGLEKDATFYLHRNLEKPYHIDYAFLPKNLLPKASVSVGLQTEWLAVSDHMPLLIKID